MDNRKIAFIMCTNSEKDYIEAKGYIERLNVPEGYSVEIIPIRNAKSMCSGYNMGMNMSDAKYKVYLHQDTYIFFKDFIYKIIEVFEDDTIGMIGVVGNDTMPYEGVMWYKERYGSMYCCESLNAVSTEKVISVNSELMDVQTVDGFLMATSVDVKWREDIFDGWDFYDISQCMEIKKFGKRIVLPVQEKPWCMHNSGCLNLENYFKNREKFVAEYMCK